MKSKQLHDFNVSSIFDLFCIIVSQCLITMKFDIFQIAIIDVNIPKHAVLSIYCLVNVSSLILQYINGTGLQNTIIRLPLLFSRQILDICVYISIENITYTCEQENSRDSMAIACFIAYEKFCIFFF